MSSEYRSRPSFGRILTPLILITIVVYLAVFVLRSCLIHNAQPAPTPIRMPTEDSQITNIEQSVLTIPITGTLSRSDAEISGMAWYNDTLILLPQYPGRLGEGDGAVFGLHHSDIIDYLDGNKTSPLEPFPIPVYAPGLENIQGFEGFEAIAFSSEVVFLTIEAKPDEMLAYLVTGEIASDLSELRLDVNNLAKIQPGAAIPNMSDEAVLIYGGQVITIYEANGFNVNPRPQVHCFDFSLQPLGTIPFPTIEYRITDAAPPNADGYFWAINYFFTGDTKLAPAHDPLANRFGEGTTHSQSDIVERLVEFRYSSEGITLTDSPPIQLQLLEEDEARNWEALAPLDGRGFLLATDKYPQTILGFVAAP